MTFIINSLRARWLLIVLCTLAAAAGGVFTAKLLPRRYQAKADILMELVKADAQTGEDIPNKLADTYVGTQLRLAMSEETAGAMVDELGWAKDPATVAQFGFDSGTPEAAVRAAMAAVVLRSAGVAVPPETNLIELSYFAPDPEFARRSVDIFRTAFLSQALERTNRQARADAAWLESRARQAGDAYHRAVTEETAFARRNGIVLAKNNRTDLELAQLSAIQRLSPVPPLGGSVALTHMGAAAQLARFDATLASAQTVLGANNPQLQQLKEQRDVLVADSGAEPASIGALGMTADREQIVAVKRAGVLRDLDTMDEFRRLQRNAEVAGRSYMRLSKRALDRKRESDANATNLHAVGDASVGSTPVFPQKRQIAAVTAAFGLVIGIQLALLLELLRRRVRSQGDLHRLGVPYLGTIRAERKSLIDRSRLRLGAMLQRRRRFAMPGV